MLFVLIHIKEKVKWFSEIDVSRDIYLSKIMKVQQTISNITKYADYIYRNIYSCYIVDDFIHLSLQKTSSSDLEMKSNVELQASILEIVDIFYELYGEDESYKKSQLKQQLVLLDLLKFYLIVRYQLQFQFYLL